MNLNYPTSPGTITDGTYRHLGHLESDEIGTDEIVTFDLSFRMTTNGVITNTLVNNTPVMTASAGLFH